MPPNSIQDFSDEESPLVRADLLHHHNEDGKDSHLEHGRLSDLTQENMFIIWFRRHRVSVVLTVSVLLGLVSGSLYGYGRYARDLKEALSLNQFEMERLGILLDTGNYLGHPVTGYIFDQCGPVVACLLGGGIVCLSYGLIHVGVILHPLWMENSGLLDVGFFMVGFGTGLGYIAALASTTKNFESTNQLSLAISVVASAYALCSTLVGISYGYLGLSEFFLFWAILIAIVNTLGATCYWMDGHNDDRDSSRMESAMSDKKPSTKTVCRENPMGTSLGNRASVESEYKTQQLSKSLDSVDVKQVCDIECNGVDLRFEGEEEMELYLVDGEDRWFAFRTIDFWVLFVAFACCTGCGLFIINNVSTMVQSMGEQDAFAGQLVTILSIANCFGRILVGMLADRYDKLLLLGVSSSIMGLALFASAFEGTSLVTLLLTVVLVAAGYGGAWVLAVGILSDWFGSDNFGKNYGVLAMGPALSGMIFNTGSAWMYESRMEPNALICLGASCYRGGFLLTGSAALLCTFLLCVLGYSRDRSNSQTPSTDKASASN